MINGISGIDTASLYQARQTLFNRIDTGQDGSIDKQEMTQSVQGGASDLVDKLFNQWDADQNGLISQIEAQSGMARLEQTMKNDGGQMAPPAGEPPPPPQEVFDTADTNEDGVVSQAELAIAMGKSEEEVSTIFSQVDTDSDGVISKSEDQAWLERMGSGPGPGGPPPATGGTTGNSVFTRADADGDDSVTKEELSTVIGKNVDELFAKIDTDGDGAISATEDEAWRQKGDKPEANSQGASSGQTAADTTEDWRTTILLSLLKGLTASAGVSAGVSAGATSLYA